MITISAEDLCTCGHDRGWHNKWGCQWIDYGEECECKVFELDANSQQSVEVDRK